MVYACGVFANAGNYKGFGDTKIVPNIELSQMEKLMLEITQDSELTDLWNKCKSKMFSLEEREKNLGMNDKVSLTLLLSIIEYKFNKPF